MKFNHSLAALAVVALVLSIPAPAAAQVKVGQHIQMTTSEGGVARGTVVSLTPDQMDFKDGDGNTSKVAFGGVRQIKVIDSKANGFIGGALAGGLGVAAVHVVTYYTGVAPFAVSLYGGKLTTGVIGGAVIGGVVGMMIDSRKMKTVYERRDGGMAVKIRPIVTAGSRGVGAQVIW